MKNSRGLILVGGLLLIGISVAFMMLVLPEVYRESSVGKLGMFHLIFAEVVLLGTFAFMDPAKRNSADLPARLALPMMLGIYALIVAGVYAATPALSSTVATALHLVLAAGLVMLIIATFLAGGHAKAVQDEDEAAQQGYDLMVLAASSAERSLSENANAADLGDVPKEVADLKERIQYSDRGGVDATSDMEQSIATGIRELGESLATIGSDGVDDALAQLRRLRAQVGERNDLLKMKK